LFYFKIEQTNESFIFQLISAEKVDELDAVVYVDIIVCRFVRSRVISL